MPESTNEVRLTLNRENAETYLERFIPEGTIHNPEQAELRDQLRAALAQQDQESSGVGEGAVDLLARRLHQADPLIPSPDWAALDAGNRESYRVEARGHLEALTATADPPAVPEEVGRRDAKAGVEETLDDQRGEPPIPGVDGDAGALSPCESCDDTGGVCAECKLPRPRCTCGAAANSEDGCPNRCAAQQKRFGPAVPEHVEEEGWPDVLFAVKTPDAGLHACLSFLSDAASLGVKARPYYPAKFPSPGGEATLGDQEGSE